MPHRIVEYIHRIGRTGRNGRKGFALTLLEQLDCRFARDIFDCLKATGKSDMEIPYWLHYELKKVKKHWLDYRQSTQGQVQDVAATSSAACPAVDVHWHGR